MTIKPGVQTYTIQIDEEQRDYIYHALAIFRGMSKMPEPELLTEMFRDLPDEEAEAPGALHGFTL